MSRRRTLSAAGLLLTATAFLGVAFAQPRARGARPKPAKPASAAPAPSPPESDPPASPEPRPEAAPAPIDGGAPASPSDAGSGVIHFAAEGGGVKPSPLNPAPPEFPPSQKADADAGETAGDLDALVGEVAALRARVSAVSDALFHARIALGLQVTGDQARVARLTVALDDGVVYTAPFPFRGDDRRPIYDHGVAPGRHAVTVDVERADRKDEGFRTSQKSRFVVEVPKDARLEVELLVGDDSTMGADFASDGDGRYDLRVRARATARKQGR